MSETFRAPARFATYAGDVTYMVGEVVGPNIFGEFLTAVTANHDPKAGTTIVGFAFGAARPLSAHIPASFIRAPKCIWETTR